MVDTSTADEVLKAFHSVFSAIATTHYRTIERQILRLAGVPDSSQSAAPLFSKLEQGADAFRATGSIQTKEELDRFRQDSFSLKYLIISDSILIYSEAVSEQTSIAGLFGEFVDFVKILVAHSFTRRLFLRGAITYGEFYADSSNSIYFGKALNKAVDLEKSQNWIGCVVSDELREIVADYISTRHPQVPRDKVLQLRNFSPLIGSTINRYPVPTHNQEPVLSYIVNWFALLFGKADPTDFFFEGQLTGNPKIDIKYKNTRAFMQWWRSSASSLFRAGDRNK